MRLTRKDSFMFAEFEIGENLASVLCCLVVLGFVAFLSYVYMREE